ncbi:MAG TPA: hypothetical protein VJL38_00585, partial [Patescibacteria group bacterium]|nr:hypothetical protein [Patescibacteria group bacterium]
HNTRLCLCRDANIIPACGSSPPQELPSGKPLSSESSIGTLLFLFFFRVILYDVLSVAEDDARAVVYR